MAFRAPVSHPIPPHSPPTRPLGLARPPPLHLPMPCLQGSNCAGIRSPERTSLPHPSQTSALTVRQTQRWVAVLLWLLLPQSLTPTRFLCLGARSFWSPRLWRTTQQPHCRHHAFSVTCGCCCCCCAATPWAAIRAVQRWQLCAASEPGCSLELRSLGRISGSGSGSGTGSIRGVCIRSQGGAQFG